MEKKKIVFVVNPRSANGATGRAWSSLAEKLRSRIGEFGALFTSRPMEAAELTRRALKDGADVVVAVGGDGTTNEVVNGFFEDGRVVREGAALAVFPRGTGGDFPKTWRWNTSVESTAARLAALRIAPLDVGRLSYTSHEGKPAQRYFVNIASAGSSGLIDRYANEGSKALGGKLSFLIASARGMLAWRDRRCRIRLDEGAWEEHDVTVLAVGNGQYFGGGMWVAPHARPDDGKFGVTIWSGFGISDFVVHTRKIYDGRHVKLRGTTTREAKVVEATSEDEVLLDVDGEAPGRLPAKWEVLPAAIRVVT